MTKPAKLVLICDLTGAALDWAVARCEGAHPQISYPDKRLFGAIGDTFDYSTDWVQGGPIIEREITSIFRNVGGTWSAMILKDVPILPEDQGTSLVLTQRMQWNAAGATPLIAAMRCYCFFKLGNEVDVPKELI